MPTVSSNDGNSLTVCDFTNTYNKWLTELVNIENNLVKKAEDTQALQSALNEDADTVNTRYSPSSVYFFDNFTISF